MLSEIKIKVGSGGKKTAKRLFSYIIHSFLLLSFLFFGLFFGISAGKAYAGDFAVITNLQGPNLSESEIKQIYTGIIKAVGGTPIKAYIVKDEKVKSSFFRFLGIGEREYRTIWLTRALSGEGTPPKELGYEEVISKVKNEINAIAIIPEDKIPEGVKVLLRK